MYTLLTHNVRDMDTHRHCPILAEDHGKGIFSLLWLVSPGRQDWWREGSISCSINAAALTTVPVPPPYHMSSPTAVCVSGCVNVCKYSVLPLSVAISSYSLVEGSAGTRGSMFMMRFLRLSELKLRLWPNMALTTQTTKFCSVIQGGHDALFIFLNPHIMLKKKTG